MKMIKILTLLLSVSTGVSMAQDKFMISGNLPAAGADKKVILTFVNSEGKSAKDSVNVEGGKFTLTGLTAFGNRAYLELKPLVKDATKKTRADFKEFFLEKGTTMVVGKDSMVTASIAGTKGQSEYLDFNAQMKPLQAHYQDLASRYYKAVAAKDSAKIKELMVEGKPLGVKMASTLDNFIAKNPDSYYTAMLVLTNKMMVIDVPKFEPIYSALTPRVLSSFMGKQITDKYFKAKQFAVGKTIDFTLPDTKGAEFKLSSLKGKYVLVDFWASWCAPCRAENPYLLKAYAELKDKNFEIVGVSLDDKKDYWLAAVAADKLPWTQVSDVKGFKTEVAVRFGITAIPQNVLIDPDGKVVAKDLRGPDVNQQIAKYLK